MSDKPKIYAFCKAGCQWETVHKDAFDRSATWISQYKNESGVYNLAPVMNYKIVSSVASNAYSCVVSLSYTDGTEKTHTFAISEYDEYRNYFYFEILSLTATATALTIVYEINGNRYSETVSGTAIDITNATLKVSGATEVLGFNADANIIADIETARLGELVKAQLNELEAKLNENIIKDPSKTYLVWEGKYFPNSSNAQFKAPANSTIDWGDGTVETFTQASATVNTHTYTDGVDYHLISISNLNDITDSAFDSCNNLIDITIGNEVKIIGVQALRYCDKLTSITVPDSVTTISDFAFYFNINLTSVTIGSGVTQMGIAVLFNCEKVSKIYMKPATPPTLGESAIPDTVQKIIILNATTGSYKKATGWSTLKDKIVREIDSSDLPTFDVYTHLISFDFARTSDSDVGGSAVICVWSKSGDDLVGTSVDNLKQLIMNLSQPFYPVSVQTNTYASTYFDGIKMDNSGNVVFVGGFNNEATSQAQTLSNVVEKVFAVK